MFHIIINPHSRTGRAMEFWAPLEEKLKELCVEYTIYKTAGPGDATKIVKKLCDENPGPVKIMIVGGDGTINEALQGMDPDKVLLAYLPLGSGNDFSRGLKLPEDPMENLIHIVNSKDTHCVDFGEMETIEGVTRRFFVSSGIGFDAAVCKEALDSKLKTFLNKLRLGSKIYSIIALKQIIGHKKTPVDLEIDGVKTHYKDILFCASMNQPYEGGGLMMSPDASASDGMIDLAIIHDIPTVMVFRILPTVYKGNHVRFTKYVTLRRCSKVSVRTSQEVAIHTDGEVPCMTKGADFRISDKKIKMIL